MTDKLIDLVKDVYVVFEYSYDEDALIQLSVPIHTH